MICPECLQERSKEDFQNKEICYKCTYRKKTKEPETKLRLCLICTTQLPTRKNKYCSYECAEKADNDYWTRKIKLSPI